MGCPIPGLLASSEDEVTRSWSCRKLLARWVSLCKRWHPPVPAVEMGTGTVAWPTMCSCIPYALHAPCPSLCGSSPMVACVPPVSLSLCVPGCPPPWGLCHQGPLCGQPSAGTGRWQQELCQPPSPACLLQCQFINIEELIRIPQPFPPIPLLRRMEDTCCLQDFAAALR